MPPRRLKLKIELIPKPLWGKNLRRGGLGKYRWDKLRRQLIDKDGARCIICGATDRKFHGHEVWDYREKKTVGTAALLNVKIVCIDCHDIHHWGRTIKLLQSGRISDKRYRHLRKHFRRTNRCAQDSFDKHILRETEVWLQRSKKKWKVDWGDFAPAVAKAKAAREAWKARNSKSDDYLDVEPGHHMPNGCPNCGAVGTLVPINANRDEMSESQEADYDAGLWGNVRCRQCNSERFWQG
jgi:hypothetical protein